MIPVRYSMNSFTHRLCRADKMLIGGGVAMLGGGALFGAGLLGVGIPATVTALLLTDGVFRPSSSLFYPTISHGPRHRPQVALTFDDGPDANVTPLLLDALDAAGAKATFFTIGRHLERHQTIARRALDAGHELANHSWQHDRLQNFYSARAHGVEIDRGARLIQQLAKSDQVPLYRPPIGLKSPALARVAQQRNLKLIAWSLHGRDTMQRDPQRIAAGILRRVKPGDIILMHDGHDIDGRTRGATAEALPLVLAGLAEKNLESVTVSKMLER